MGNVDPADVTQDHAIDNSNSDHAIKGKKYPEAIGRYQIKKVLGEGGFGVVYLARDEQLDRLVAIKVPHAGIMSKPSDVAAFLTEARTVALLDHAHIVPVHDIGSTEEFSCFVVSKYIEGTDLSATIKRKRFTFVQSAELVASIAEALHSAHLRGVVHRDIKPANILLDAKDRAYVVDFGLALREESFGKGARCAGTPLYMSPEQARGEGHRVDGRSDIFSLGVVFYELLVGRRPFQADTQKELLDQISTMEARPPRQLDDTIPRELERILMKAIAKRSSDRYTTALDFAEDLRHFLKLESRDVSSFSPPTNRFLGVESTQAGADCDTRRLDSSSQTIHVVPKGLRSFDSSDADFFLQLMPGARDRDGLPDCIRFWKSRIEDPNLDVTAQIGVIYGPSGCGKTSLVKAGLLPRLGDDVIPIYIEATPEATEFRLFHNLRERFPSLEAHSQLKDVFAAIRRHEHMPGTKKLLLVFDQFEQWLQANRNKENTELVQALRQCDGANVQCIVMVRDDFWMATTQFMRELEIQLIEGQNSLAVDLFPIRHAERVLAAYGRAFGVLPADGAELTKGQASFVQQSAAGLAVDGKVVCVRLSLFAEMMKGKEWNPKVLKEVGGTQGVGVTYLEETFGSSSSRLECRHHAKGVRAVLEALLADSDTDLKGQMKSYDDLSAAAKYESRPAEFRSLIHILDRELRLITATDPTGTECGDGSESSTQERQAYYQLAHDYLVPSVKSWLNLKQIGTRRGRAEIRLAERTSYWRAKPGSNRLPSWWEFVAIRLLTKKKKWDQNERRMMSNAGWIHGVRSAVSIVVLLILAFGVHRLVDTFRQDALRQRIKTSVAALNTSRGVILPPLSNFDEYPRDPLIAELRAQFEAASGDRQLILAYALAKFGDVRVPFLVSQIKTASPDEVDNFVAALGAATSESIPLIEATASKAESENDWSHKARLAMLAFHMGAPALSEEMCAAKPDPIQRTWFIEECATWHGDLTKLAQSLEHNTNETLRSGIALVVGSAPLMDVSHTDKQRWAGLLSDWYRNNPDGLMHSTSSWVLRRWKLELPDIASSVELTDGFHWHVNSIGTAMLRIKPGGFVHKVGLNAEIDQTVTVTKPFLIASREITRWQFQQFIDDPEYPTDQKPADWSGANTDFSPSEMHPVQRVSWFDAILFCNWLSSEEGLEPAYEQYREEDLGTERLSLSWRLIPESNGYRLPTEAEWEYACRAGSTTRYPHGNDEQLIGRYSVVGASRTEVPGSKLPNGWGLFDVNGNVYEWCNNWFENYSTETSISDPMGPTRGTSRVLRGGSFDDAGRVVGSSDCFVNAPDARSNGDGFRLARSLK